MIRPTTPPYRLFSELFMTTSSSKVSFAPHSPHELQIQKLLSELRSVEVERQNLRAALEAIQNSRSWKLTAPIRWAAETVRRVRPVYRNRRVVARVGEGRSVIREEGRFVVSGPSPSVSLDFAGKSPGGWVQILSDARSDNGVFCCMLYFRQGETFEAAHRVWVTFTNDNRYPIIVRLPSDTKGIRLDPFDAEESFSIDAITFRELGSINLAGLVARRYFREARANPRAFFYRYRRAVGIVRRDGFRGLLSRLSSNRQSHDYGEWVQRYDQVGESKRPQIENKTAEIGQNPLISVVMPVYNSPELHLRQAIESVINQVYQNWELCIADDCSTDREVRGVLEEYERKDPRIKVTYRDTNGHISDATNTALALATGEWVSFLDHDDELTIDAFATVAATISKNPEASILYSDEDKKTAHGVRFNPYFKPDYNPELLLSQNYFCHLTTYRRSLVNEIGGMRRGVEGAQDWDLALRAIDAIKGKGIIHIPHILYHWRVIEGSTAQSTSYKPYVLEAQKRAVQDHLARRGEDATVNIDHDIHQLQVSFHIPTPPPRISLVIPTRDMVSVLHVCVESIFEKTRYPAFDIVIVDNGSVEEATLSYFRKLSQRKEVQIIRDESPFNFSRLNNLAVRQTSTPLVGLINNDLETIDDMWLDHLVSQAIRPEIGAVGARLYFPNDLLQHGGIILGIGGVAGHSHKGRPRHDGGYFNRVLLPQAVSGVTAACLILRRTVYDEVGGLDEEHLQVAFNDVDFCLRIREKGYRIVYQPYAELYHHESASRGSETTPEKFNRFEREVSWMKQRWGDQLKNDSYYNPNLTLLTEDYGFASPPRRLRFWQK
jgi:GT2 family glycosyltransferase